MTLSGIHAIGTPPVIQPPQVARPDAAGPKTDFASLVRKAVETVDQDQQASATGVEQLLSGRRQDVLPVVTAVAKADASFKLLIGVRNKMIEAYKQTINMQV
ncbi:MAG: flagellar hook-basal body complex protein FliE [Planctomycetes bacterium]|nr:flagellar hook-basal body complex protein FliE [Planctomycetota bacterium]